MIELEISSPYHGAMTGRALIAVLFFPLLGGCASVLNITDARTTVPCQFERNGRIVVPVMVNGAGPFRFALDTGATISVVFESLQKQLELPVVPGKGTLIRGVAASQRVALVQVDRMTVGDEVWTDTALAVLPGRTSASRSIDGILGTDFLQQYAVGFFADENVVRLYDPQVVAERGYYGWSNIRLTPRRIGSTRGALFFFHVKVGDDRIPAVFDLGASLNLVNGATVDKLDIRRDDLTRVFRYAGALKTIPISAVFRVDRVATARVWWEDELFAVADLEIFSALIENNGPVAILGAGLFTQRDFIVDFVRRRLLINVSTEERMGP